MLRTTTWVSLVVLLGYLVLAHTVGNLYPFSTFDMYATSQLSVGSRIIAVDSTGHAHEVRRFTNFACDGPVVLDPETCPNRHIPYLADALQAYLTANLTNQSPGGVALQIVQRVWWFAGDGELISVEDCPVLTCRADAVP